MGAAGVIASGIGSMPGEDFAEAVRIVLGESPDLPYLPELPGRGVTAQMTGRTLALVGVNQRIKNVLDVTRVLSFFKIFDTVEDAETVTA